MGVEVLKLQSEKGWQAFSTKRFGYYQLYKHLQRQESNSMIISDLEHLEVVSEETNVEGGFASANAGAGASASGNNFAATSTSTYTSATSGYYYYYPYYYYGLPNSASSSSGSSSTAA